MNFGSLFTADDIDAVERHTGLVSELDLKGAGLFDRHTVRKADANSYRRDYPYSIYI